jgi:hypothetical protein
MRAASLIAVALITLLGACSDDDGPSRDARATDAASDDASTDQTIGEPRGSIDETVDAPPGVIADPVSIDEATSFGNGVAIRVASLEAVDATAQGPGEVSGPGVLVAVEITNGSSETINLDTVTVDLARDDGASASQLTLLDKPAFAGDLAAGESAVGSYVFTIDEAERSSVTLRVKYSAELPTVVFAGSVPRV